MAKTGKNISQTVIIPKNSHEDYLQLDTPESYALNKANITNAGISRLTAGYEIIRPQPRTHVVLFITEGQLCYKDITGETRRAAKGERLTLPLPVAEHYWSESYFEMFWFHLRGSEDWSELTRRGIEQKKTIWFDELYSSVKRYIAESESTHQDSESLAEQYAILTAAYLKRELKGVTSGRKKSTHEAELDRLFKLVESELTADWSVEALAERVYTSPSRLHRLCREVYNATPMQLVRERRLARAHEILINTDYPLQTIATLVGYETPFALSKAFKATYSLPPSKLRKLAKPSQSPDSSHHDKPAT